MNRPIAALLLAALSFCAYAKKDAPKTPEELAATHGYLRLSVPQWEFATELNLTASQGKKDSLFPAITKRPGLRSRGGWIPAGQYQLTGVQGVDGKPWAPITVRAGELTDLGVLLRVPIGGYEYMVVPLVDAALDGEIAEARDSLKSVLKSPEAILWRPDSLPQTAKFTESGTGLGLIADLLIAYDRKLNKPALSKTLKETRGMAEFLALARTAMPPRVEEAAVDSQGNLYYAAELGQLRVRDRAGNWSNRDTGTLLELTAVESSGDLLVAGNLRGQLLASTGGGAWKVAHALDASEAVLDIDRAGSRWFVVAATFVETQNPFGFAAAPPGTPRPWSFKGNLRIYSGTQDDLSDLALLKEVPMAELWATHMRGAAEPVIGHVVGNLYVVNTLTGIQKLDLAGMTWSTAVNPGHRVDGIRFSKDGKLLTARRNQGAFSKVSLSTDLGATWTPYSRPPYIIYDLVLQTPESGTATRWNMNTFGVALEFYKYDPKVKDWRKDYETPAGCVQMLRDADFEQRYCLTTGGSILDYRDNAWVAEFGLE